MSNTTTGSHRSRAKIGVALSVATLAGAVAIVSADGSAAGDGWEAVAVLRDANGKKVGKVSFEGDRNGTEVKAEVHGITVGLGGYHGFHLHTGDGGGPCDPAAPAGPFTNVGGHWQHAGEVHGNHAGDLPSLQVLLDGTGSARSLTGRFAAGDIAGRAVILHAGPDNFANIPGRYVSDDALGDPPASGPDAATKGTGDAGARIACGIVEPD